MRSEEISGPDWLAEERYNVIAKLPPKTNAEEFKLMLQNLLTERFSIRLHYASETLPVYDLTVSRNGPKLQPAEAPGSAVDDADAAQSRRVRAQKAMEAMSRNREPGSWRTFSLPSATIAKFAQVLSSYLDHPVKDNTQLDGVYSFTLKWVLDPVDASGSSGDFRRGGPSIFAAVQEQLGLRLQSAKEQMEMLVIDNAARSPASK